MHPTVYMRSKINLISALFCNVTYMYANGLMVLYLLTLRSVIDAIVSIYNLAIVACNLFQKYNLFHDNCKNVYCCA